MNKKLICLSLLLLAGCASHPPAALDITPPPLLTLAEVRADAARHVGATVRWGGEIVQVENRESASWIEVVARPLRSDASPISGGHSEGRFIASLGGFADPVVYQPGRRLTVTGTLAAPVTRPIGDYAYEFPLVNVSGSHLWKIEPVYQPPDYPPPGYLPWWYYDPWWPYYPRYYPHPRW